MITINFENQIWSVYRYGDEYKLVPIVDVTDELIFSEDEFDSMLENGKISVYDSIKDTSTTMHNFNIISDTEANTKRINTKFQIIKLSNQLPKDYNYKDKVLYIENFFKSQNQSYVSKSTIYRTLKKYDNSGRRIHCFIPKKQKRKPRLSAPIQEVILNRIHSDYANKERINIKTLYEKIRCDVHLMGLKEGGNIHDSPSYQTICNYIKNYDEKLNLEKRRLGPQEFHKRHAKVHSSVDVTYPLERVEIDHTDLDIALYVEDEINKKILYGRPKITMIKDHYTKCLLGYYISFNATNTDAVLKCMKHAIQSKKLLIQANPDLDEEWFQCGLFKSIVVDGAKEFYSGRFEQACLELGIHIIRTAKFEPWLKGTIESAFGSVNSLLRRLPAHIRKDNIAGQKIDRKNIISFDQFMHIFNLWIIKDYHYKYNSNIRTSPNILWNQSVKNIYNKSQFNDNEINIIFSETKFKQLSRKGILNLNVRYNSEELNKKYLRVNAINSKDCSVKIKINHDDISYIYIYDSIEKNYIKVDNIDGVVKNTSLIELKNINRRRNLERKRVNDIYLNKSLIIEEAIENAKKRSKYDHNKLK